MSKKEINLDLEGVIPEITNEQTEKFKEQLRQRRKELPVIIEALKDNKELLELMGKTGNYAMLEVVAKRLDACDVETVCECMCEGVLNILKKYKKNDNVAEGNCIKTMRERVEFLREQMKKDNLIPHQYHMIVANISRIMPEQIKELTEIIAKTNITALGRAEQALESYKRVKLGE